MRWGVWAAALAVAGCAAAVPAYCAEDGVMAARLAPAGDPARGRQVVMGRDSNCLLCHSVPESGPRFMGNLGPPLAGVGARLTEGQLRLRIADSARLNPDTIMPPYYRTDGLNRVGEAWRGKPVLDAQQVEDTVAYLLTLR